MPVGGGAAAANRRIAASSIAPIFPISALPASLRYSVLAHERGKPSACRWDITELGINHLGARGAGAERELERRSLTGVCDRGRHRHLEDDGLRLGDPAYFASRLQTA